MTSARDRMLAALSEGLAKARNSGDRRSDFANRAAARLRRGRQETEESAAAAGAEATALREPFVSALTALGGHAHTAQSHAAAIDIVAGLFDRYASPVFISWDESEIPCPGLMAALASRGRRRVTYDVPSDQDGRAAVLASLEPVAIGLTGALAGISESGTIVLASGPGRGRLASLLPPVHIAMLSERTLCPTLAAALEREPSLVDKGSNVVLITGPSRTADIEMTLTHGVHGPRHLHVVILTEDAT